ncbi:MAG: hypothetical protein ACYDAZ_08800 [Thermoplasmataceae archaeon]
MMYQIHTANHLLDYPHLQSRTNYPPKYGLRIKIFRSVLGSRQASITNFSSGHSLVPMETIDFSSQPSMDWKIMDGL